MRTRGRSGQSRRCRYPRAGPTGASAAPATPPPPARRAPVGPDPRTERRHRCERPAESSDERPPPEPPSRPAAIRPAPLLGCRQRLPPAHQRRSQPRILPRRGADAEPVGGAESSTRTPKQARSRLGHTASRLLARQHLLLPFATPPARGHRSPAFPPRAGVFAAATCGHPRAGAHPPRRVRIAMAECEIQRTPYLRLRMPAVPGVGIGTVAGSGVDRLLRREGRASPNALSARCRARASPTGCPFD